MHMRSVVLGWIVLFLIVGRHNGDRRPPSLSGSSAIQVDRDGGILAIAPQGKPLENMSVNASNTSLVGIADCRVSHESKIGVGHVLIERIAQTVFDKQIFVNSVMRYMLFLSPVVLVCIIGVSMFMYQSHSKEPPNENFLDSDGESDDSESGSSAPEDIDLSFLEKFAWTSEDKTSELFRSGSTLDIDPVLPPWSPASVVQCLESHGIETSLWESTDLETLSQELSKGKARLFYDNKIVRVVDIVLVIVEYSPMNVVAQEVSHLRHERNFQELPERIPKARMLINESLADAVHRCLNQKLGLPSSLIQNVECLDINEESEENGDTMPGLTSVVRKIVTRVKLQKMETQLCEAVGLSCGRLSLRGQVFAWEPVQQLHSLRKYYRNSDTGRATRTVLTHESHPILLWDTASVLDLVAKHGLYGTDELEHKFGKPIGELVSMLKAGSCSFGISSSSKELICVEETVSLCVSANGYTLVETDSHDSDAVSTSLPCVTKWADESTWAAASRLVRWKFGALALHLHMEEISDKEVTTSYNGSAVKGSGHLGFVSRTFLVRAGAPLMPGFSRIKVLFEAKAYSSEVESEGSDGDS